MGFGTARVRNRQIVVGKEYGRLTVLYKTTSTKFNGKAYLCRCSCGVEKVITGRHILGGRIRSCLPAHGA